MTLIILPIAFIAGLVLGDARRASRTSFLIWLVAIVALLIAKVSAVRISPWEALALLVCLPPALLLARLAAHLRGGLAAGPRENGHRDGHADPG
jgi:hypothetical protein